MSLGSPAGTSGYADLFANSAEFDVEGMNIRFASVDDLIRMKRAAGRPIDQIHIEILQKLNRRS